jgi:hypothetical protein
MSENTRHLRTALNHTLDTLEMVGFNDGFESALTGLDELSNMKHNEGNEIAGEILRWAATELRGENC